MRFSSVLAAGAALTAALLTPATASPTAMSTIPNTISGNVRKDLVKMPPNNYTLYNLHAESKTSTLVKRARIDGIQTRCTTRRCFSMTFDDGPYTWMTKLVDTLDNAGGQKATFFVNGNNYRCIYDKASVARLRYAYERNHQICSHGWSHPDISKLNNRQLDRQVQLVEDALWKILGVVPACFRAPYGSIRDDQVQYLNDRWGLVVVHWNHDTNDANGYGTEYGLNLYRNLKAPKHAIILNHETVAGTPNTVIPRAVKIGRRNGYKGSQTTAATLRYNPYKVVASYGHRDDSWTCDDKPAPGGV
ncbi:hypothetical protein NDA13_002763 [Ustilago tritici]|nr:hypothetical protein NDA13_002763 [Ustilago tritici]